MSTNLDKSLDDIIKAKPRKTVPKKKASGAGVRKASTATTKAQPKKKAPTSKAATKKAPGLTNLDEVAVLADRVILSNIPLDIDEKSIKEYFSSEIGPIRNVQPSFNAKGKRTGVFTINFAKPGLAVNATNRFNGTAIDGKTIMKVELVMDPTKKPLSTRLQPPKAPANKAAAATAAKPNQPKKAAAPKKKAASNKKKAVRRPKKSLEELDAEMADYFKESSAPAAATA